MKLLVMLYGSNGLTESNIPKYNPLNMKILINCFLAIFKSEESLFLAMPRELRKARETEPTVLKNKEIKPAIPPEAILVIN